MLSTENPPPDLCEISQLKSGSDDTRKKQQLEVEVDLSGLEYNNPLPNFSIRDYVFNTRGKDIENNWPFSRKNLQLCVKHGVKDVLPPFQSLDSVGNPFIVDTLRYSDVKHPEVSHGKRPAVNIEDINSSECGEDKEFPSTTTSQSCSDINSVLPIRNRQVSRSEKKPESKKAESNIQSLVKKCKLVVKLNNIGEPKSNEDSAVNTLVVSESMASKVCPVCKTFSSSSNTTLNAHIDQCLSGESTIKWTTNSKVIKHRIKPRKTRLMVDIYETALSCTLEDLDKRNGTNWASNMGLHPQDLEDLMEEEEEEEKEEEKVEKVEKEKKTFPQFDFEDINEEGDVYIDSSGTKLRILSKLNHLPLSKSNVNDSGACHFVKRDKGIKLLSSKKKMKKKKKKKHSLQKLELQKNPQDGQGSCSPIPDHLSSSPLHSPERVEINYGQQKLLPTEDDEEDDPTKSPTASDHMKSDDFGMIKQWVGSKRTGLKKKINLDPESQRLDKSLKNSITKSVSSHGNEGNSAPISPVSSDENSALSREGLKRKENVCRSLDGSAEQPCVRKGPGSSLLRSEYLSEKKNNLMSSKLKVKRSRNNTTSDHGNFVDPLNHSENHASSRSNKTMGISSSPFVKNDSSYNGSHNTFSSEGKNASLSRKMSSSHSMSSVGRKFSSLRTKLLSVRHASGVEPTKNLGRDRMSFKSPRSRCTSQSDEEAAVSQSTLHAENRGNSTPMENGSGALLSGRTRVFKNHKRIGGFVGTGEGETSHESDDSANVGKKIDSFISGSVPVDTSNDLGEDDAEMLGDFVCEPASTDGEEAFASFSKSLDSAFPNVECVSQYYGKAYDENCPTELAFHADQEVFCADKNLVARVSHEMAEMDGDEAQGNYFVDVDPIPIPGPPGSFLPSPGRMGSEDILGHSSLTTCRLQSSDDGHEVVDMDSSESPISAISTVSNSVAGRSNSVSTTNFSAQSHFQHETQRDISGERNTPVAEGSLPLESIASRVRDVNLLKSNANVMFPQSTREVQNTQPCCCSRKDVSSLQGGGPLNHQESQILRRRTMNSLPVLAQETQINDAVKNNDVRFMDLRAEIFSQKEPASIMPIPHNSEAMFRGCGDCELPSPSTSNPVLRLMGKNLMVVNKDENLPEYPGVRFCVENGGRNNQNERNSSFHHMLSRGAPSTFDNLQFNFNQSDAFKIPTNYRPSSQHPSAPMFPSTSFGDNASSASGYHEYGGAFSSIRPYHQTAYDTGRVGPGKADSCGGRRNEIIIIDDSPESEAPSPIDSRNVNPFYSYEMRGNPRFSGSPVAAASRNPIAPPPPKGMNVNLGKWNCIPEGSSVLHSNPSTASLPPSVHNNLRSLYFAPGFS